MLSITILSRHGRPYYFWQRLRLSDQATQPIFIPAHKIEHKFMPHAGVTVFVWVSVVVSTLKIGTCQLSGSVLTGTIVAESTNHAGRVAFVFHMANRLSQLVESSTRLPDVDNHNASLLDLGFAYWDGLRTFYSSYLLWCYTRSWPAVTTYHQVARTFVCLVFFHKKR